MGLRCYRAPSRSNTVFDRRTAARARMISHSVSLCYSSGRIDSPRDVMIHPLPVSDKFLFRSNVLSICRGWSGRTTQFLLSSPHGGRRSSIPNPNPYTAFSDPPLRGTLEVKSGVTWAVQSATRSAQASAICATRRLDSGEEATIST